MASIQFHDSIERKQIQAPPLHTLHSLQRPKVAPRPLEGDGGLLPRQRRPRPSHVVVGGTNEALLELGDEVVRAVLDAALEGQVGARAEHRGVAAVETKKIFPYTSWQNSALSLSKLRLCELLVVSAFAASYQSRTWYQFLIVIGTYISARMKNEGPC